MDMEFGEEFTVIHTLDNGLIVGLKDSGFTRTKMVISMKVNGTRT